MATPEMHARLGRLARSQHGVFTRSQAKDAGFTPGEIDGRVHRRVWIPVDYSVYRAAETPASWLQRVMAACLAGPAVASHRTAAALWGFSDFPRDIVEVTALRHRRRWKDDVVWHESVRLDAHETTVVEGIPVTNPTRTIIDLGAVVAVRDVVRAIDDGVRRRLTAFPKIERELERWSPQRRGAGTVRRALRWRADGVVTDSTLESAFDALVRERGLPEPVRQWPIKDAGGKVLMRVDFAYPAARVAIELQSIEHHFDFEGRLRDMSRENELAAINWRLLQFTDRDVRRRPDYVVTKILAALSSDALLDPPDEGDLRIQ